MKIEEQEIIEIHGKKYNLYKDETLFVFTSALGVIMAEGIIFTKDISALKEFRDNTISTEVLIYNRKTKKYQRADTYKLEK